MMKINLNEFSLFVLELHRKIAAQTEPEKTLLWPLCPRELYTSFAFAESLVWHL